MFATPPWIPVPLTFTCSFHSRLPLHQVERIIYSTCSVHDLENEEVVAAALEAQTELRAGVHALY